MVIWNIFIEVTVGLSILTVASGGMSPLPAPRVLQQDNMEAVMGGVVSMVTQGLGQCRLLVVTATPVTDMLAHVLGVSVENKALPKRSYNDVTVSITVHSVVLFRGLRGDGDDEEGGVVVMEDTSSLSTSLIVPKLVRDGGASCWTLVLLLAEVSDADDTLNDEREGSNNTTDSDGRNEGGRKDIYATFKNSNQGIERSVW
ncbi:hypothetical protein E2C01_002570 [Portunus trituberculatus]|uniref:Uncharacterized protein n=1 Tax=Portunus trituberculatus TaxID=210409 RepID=A0A5B7CKQ3_PORTR|nr:hypothetical protein [Portunus trituberculatus]